jgi:hypothetical protein
MDKEMKTYKVYLSNIHYYETTVEASDEDEAYQIASELTYDETGPEVSTNGFEVDEIQED